MASQYYERMKARVEELRKKDTVTILAIESSCDETSIAVVRNGREVLSNIISSQIEIHKRFGGVVPEVASRNHIECIDNVYKQALEEAGIVASEIDAVAVTFGAGLVGALFVGVNFAKSLAYALDIPLIAVNHIVGHISANYIADQELTPPFMCLVISGGHSNIFEVVDYNTMNLIGQTLDDAVGECFDKVARVLGISYPGGPNIEKNAQQGNNNIVFKRSNSTKHSYNFSFSGIKTAVINYVNNLRQKSEEINVFDICCSFQSLVAKELATKVVRASVEHGYKRIVVAGGVSANKFIINRIREEASPFGILVSAPPLVLCTDNAGMIGSAGYYKLMSDNSPIADIDLTAVTRFEY